MPQNFRGPCGCERILCTATDLLCSHDRLLIRISFLSPPFLQRTQLLLVTPLHLCSSIPLVIDTMVIRFVCDWVIDLLTISGAAGSYPSNPAAFWLCNPSGLTPQGDRCHFGTTGCHCHIVLATSPCFELFSSPPRSNLQYVFIKG